MKLADLMYGHGSEFMCSLSGRFSHEKYPDAPPIQICEMKCGCWIVADGNNRVGLILKKNPEATIADIREWLLATARFGEWDAEMMYWWNPCARSFGEVMGKRGKKARAPKNSIYGIIERDEEGKFVASTHALKKGVTASAIGHTADEAKRFLEDKLKIMLETGGVSLVLTAMTPLEDYRCSCCGQSGIDWTNPLSNQQRQRRFRQEWHSEPPNLAPGRDILDRGGASSRPKSLQKLSLTGFQWFTIGVN